MLIWVNKKKARKEIKRAWVAFNNHACEGTGKQSIQEYLLNLESFADAMANIAWMLGVHDNTPPSEWDC